jgi:multiple sugar transport system permease protein
MLRQLFIRRKLFKPSPGGTILSYLALGFWTLVVLFPLYWLFVTSFKTPIDVSSGPYYIPFVDFKPTIEPWQYILVGDLSNDTLRTYFNTLTIAPLSAFLALVIGSGSAYALTRFDYHPRMGAVLSFIACVALAIVLTGYGIPWLGAVTVAFALYLLLFQTIGKRFGRALGNDDIAFWMISQRMLPPIAVVIPIFILFQQLHLLDTHLALIITYVTINLPIVVWLMRDYFLTIPIELEECAQIDGASRFSIFHRIVLPLALPGLVATFLFVLVFTWNEYLLAQFLSTANAQTLPYLIAAQNGVRGPQWSYMSVLILIMIIPVIAVAIALERYISRGLLIGAIK